ncbi:MAG: hypothetical protein M1826_000201 [Phylliscum demangeonii]|nr:MAG: hypothetical protein M1826_000201 [Phylliscum demangeonii]
MHSQALSIPAVVAVVFSTTTILASAEPPAALKQGRIELAGAAAGAARAASGPTAGQTAGSGRRGRRRTRSRRPEKEAERIEAQEKLVASYLGMLEGKALGGQRENILPPGARQLALKAADPIVLDRLVPLAHWHEVVDRCIDQLGRDRATTLARWSLPASTTTGQPTTESHDQARRAVDENNAGPHQPLNFLVHRVGTKVHRLVHGVQAWQRAAWPAHAGMERTMAKVKNAEQWGVVTPLE